MTEEEALKELRDYSYDKAVERRKLEMLEEIKNDCMKMSSVLSDMPKAPTANVHKIEEKYIRYLDLQSEVMDLLSKNLVKTIQITKKIQSLEQPYRNVLELKYIKNEKLWQIAEDLNFSNRTIDRVFKKSIQKYAKK